MFNVLLQMENCPCRSPPHNSIFLRPIVVMFALVKPVFTWDTNYCLFAFGFFPQQDGYLKKKKSYMCRLHRAYFQTLLCVFCDVGSWARASVVCFVNLVYCWKIKTILLHKVKCNKDIELKTWVGLSERVC